MKRTVVAALFVAALLTACGAPVVAPSSLDPLSGQYSASGGGGAMPAVQALAARFKELHPGVVFTVTETGSDAAIRLATAGNVDIGFVSRQLKSDEQAVLAAQSIGFSGTGIVVNASNPVKNLTREQLRRIYSGEATNWAELDGPDVGIRAFMRERRAATRTTFEAYVFAGLPTYGSNVVELLEVEPMLSAIASFSGAVGVATIGSRTASDSRLRMVWVDGVAPTQENLANGAYKIERPLFLIYPLDAAKLKPAVRAFIDFAKSEEGQRVATSGF